jgi:hypothetical protein
MMNFKYQYAFLTAFIMLFVMACKKDFNPEINLPRQFKPGDISINAGETQARLQWSPSLFTTGTGSTYTVEVSQDSLFQGPIVFTRVVDSAFAVVTDSVLMVNEFYFARVKANTNGSTAESGWVHSSRFRITGEQIFLPISDAQLKDTTVVLRWRASDGLTSIRLTPAGGTATTVNLSAADVNANEKLISGLTPLTQYTAEIFRNNLLKGTITFTTKEKNIYAFTLSEGDDLLEAVNSAAIGDLIGLNPGIYSVTNSSGAYVNLVILQKNITITSISGNPADTRVNFKEITLKGSGAGVTLRGIEFNGAAGNADYFINFTGLATDAEAANFGSVVVDNSIVRSTNNSLIRGNRGGNNAHKIDSITLRNSIFADNGSSAGFDYILLDKMEFNSLLIRNSTFYNSGRRLISWATNITAPKPVILIDQVTINSIGYGGRDFVLIDANANPVDFTMKNSIMANTPKPGQTVGNNLLRASNTSSSVVISHSNLFNLSNGTATPADLIIAAYVVQQNNISVDLGWTGTTTSFTLPASSPVRTASETNGPIGDPRWW